MNEYHKQAEDFLSRANATMDIVLVGTDSPTWSHGKHNHYAITITTPKGKMQFDFWDSLYNTEITLMSIDDYCVKCYRMHAQHLSCSERNKCTRELKKLKNEAIPHAYDILACMTKYDVGTMHDFFNEFGYVINSPDDMFGFMNDYNSVVKEYRDLCRIFTAEQMEELREIN